ncbi:MAG: hypothetical protein AB7O24_06755 [Kofleriaceae bacterium]
MRTLVITSLALVTQLTCGPPVLRDAPRPDPAAVAGASAALAGAAALADPNAAQKRQEQAMAPEQNNKGVKVKETVPADVFDRLDKGPPSDAGVPIDAATTTDGGVNAPRKNVNLKLRPDADHDD